MAKKSKRISNHPKLTLARKQLRTHGTAAEAVLWTALKNRQLDGWRWRRQFSIGHFILDFYCPQAKLGIELDGQQHFTAIGLGVDNFRMRELSAHGIRILRFENKSIKETPEAVLDYIRSVLNEITQT